MSTNDPPGQSPPEPDATIASNINVPTEQTTPGPVIPVTSNTNNPNVQTSPLPDVAVTSNTNPVPATITSASIPPASIPPVTFISSNGIAITSQLPSLPLNSISSSESQLNSLFSSNITSSSIPSSSFNPSNTLPNQPSAFNTTTLSSSSSVFPGNMSLPYPFPISSWSSGSSVISTASDDSFSSSSMDHSSSAYSSSSFISITSSTSPSTSPSNSPNTPSSQNSQSASSITTGSSSISSASASSKSDSDGAIANKPALIGGVVGGVGGAVAVTLLFIFLYWYKKRNSEKAYDFEDDEKMLSRKPDTNYGGTAFGNNDQDPDEMGQGHMAIGRNLQNIDAPRPSSFFKSKWRNSNASKESFNIIRGVNEVDNIRPSFQHSIPKSFDLSSPGSIQNYPSPTREFNIMNNLGRPTVAPYPATDSFRFSNNGENDARSPDDNRFLFSDRNRIPESDDFIIESASDYDEDDDDDDDDEADEEEEDGSLSFRGHSFHSLNSIARKNNSGVFTESIS